VIGASTVAASAYISEISPANDRERLVTLCQINIVLDMKKQRKYLKSLTLKVM
jgi:hypothetical protein